MVGFNDADDFFNTMAEGGNAFRLTDVDGIGPATAEKITSIRGVNNLSDIQDMSADELSDKAGISYSRAEKAIKGAGGNPNISKQNDSSLSNTSAAGISQPQGDFLVDFAELDKARAKNDARSRSEAAVRADDRQRAPVTTDYEMWKDNKAKFDFPGVDTPKEEPNLLPKDVKAGDPNTADFQARDERMKERKEQSYPRKEKDGRVLQEKGNRILAADVAGDIPEGRIPGLAPGDFEMGAGTSMVADGLGGPMFNRNDEQVRETDRPDKEQAPPEAALQAQARGEVADIPDIPGVDEDNAPGDLVEDFNAGLIGLREFADQLDERV